jgi:hypothetical protein
MGYSRWRSLLPVKMQTPNRHSRDSGECPLSQLVRFWPSANRFLLLPIECNHPTRKGGSTMANMRIVAMGLAGFIVLAPGILAAEPNNAPGGVHDCAGVSRSCGPWAANGANTCRTCQQAQCKTENGKDVIAGNKTQTECYEGHGKPPAKGAPKGSSPKGSPHKEIAPTDSSKGTPRQPPGRDKQSVVPQKK